MNGEFQELYNKIDVRMATVETLIDERWKNHKEASSLRHAENREELRKINEWLTDLPCKERIGVTASNANQIRVLWGVVLIIIGCMAKLAFF